MHLPDMPLLNMLREKMSWLNARQGVLSQNVANADTPGYEARDLKPIDFTDELRKATRADAGALRRTDPHHIAIKSSSAGFEEEIEGQGLANSQGNSVAIEEEMIKVADTQAQYQAAANLYAKSIALMKTAIGHGGN